jgi:hypothetical protein
VKLKQWALNLGIIVGSLWVGIVIGEIALRIAGIADPPPPDPELETLTYTVKDQYRGWAPKPNAVTVWTGEGIASEIRMNSAGFRDRERSINKPENGFRVAVLGDSFIEALHVPQEQTATAVMERQLADCPALKNRSVEVMNFGVQGYGTAQALMTLRHHAWQFSPDLVILGFYPGNDIRNNYRPLEHDHLRPYFVLDNGHWKVDYSFRTLDPKRRDDYGFSQVDYLPREWVQRSRILQLIRQVEMNAKHQPYLEDYQEINIGYYREPVDHHWQAAWQVTEALMLLMRDEVTAKNADFMVVAMSDSYQVHPDPKYRQQFMADNQILNLFYPDQRIATVLEREEIPVLRLAEPMVTIAEQRGECLHGFENALPCQGHWNILGNQIAGELMAAAVCQLESL